MGIPTIYIYVYIKHIYIYWVELQRQNTRRHLERWFRNVESSKICAIFWKIWGERDSNFPRSLYSHWDPPCFFLTREMSHVENIHIRLVCSSWRWNLPWGFDGDFFSPPFLFVGFGSFLFGARHECLWTDFFRRKKRRFLYWSFDANSWMRTGDMDKRKNSFPS